MIRGISSSRYFSSTTNLPILSEVKYKVKRKQFNKPNENDLKYFTGILSQTRILTNTDDVLPYNIDWIRNCRGQSSIVLKPKTTSEVSNILSYCNEKNLAVCPQGGNTGLVGGSVPVFDEIVINLELMNKVIDINETSGTMVCEAGCILEKLDISLKEHNLMMPLDLGAKGNCQIGGNVSTNAGGLRLLRYGNLQGNILGLEVVKADGEVIDCLRSLKKDNTGYHLKHLFIGSEGTLGIVTKIAIQCPVLPKAISLAFLGVETFEDVLCVYRNAKLALGEILSAFELADSSALDASMKAYNVINPISESPFYILIETNGSNEIHDLAKLNIFLENQMNSGRILDGTVAHEPSKIKTIWSLRENISNAVLHDGYVFKYDVSIPLNDYYKLIPLLKERLTGEYVRVCGYGHIGDGNLHINITTKTFSNDVMQKIEPYIYEEVSKMNGSISAEHGIGFRKPNYMHYSKDKSCIRLMQQLKNLMDPKGILNPYKVLPSHVENN